MYLYINIFFLNVLSLILIFHFALINHFVWGLLTLEGHKMHINEDLHTDTYI